MVTHFTTMAANATLFALHGNASPSNLIDTDKHDASTAKNNELLPFSWTQKSDTAYWGELL